MKKHTNIYKALNNTYYMPKKDFKDTKRGPKEKTKAETVIVKGTITLNQRQTLRKLIGVLGSNEQDVIGKILTIWLYNEGFLRTDNSKSNKPNQTKK